MWLLSTTTLELKQFFDSKTPPYAILSHTWDKEELTFEDVRSTSISRHQAGYHKVHNFCKLAKTRGHEYAWIDTCCIDKRSSAELSEAINSMYRYYSEAQECLIYMSDVPDKGRDGVDYKMQLMFFAKSKWFARGWTLQELIAPKERIFLSENWKPIEDEGDLIDLVAEIAKIDPRLLRDRDLLTTYCTAERMSWASKRETTRSEDIVYSLFGVFNVSLPVLYGEGTLKAFRRLQEEIMRNSFDQTLFVWRGDYQSSGLLAKSPADFKNTPRLGLWAARNLSPFNITNVGLSLRLNVLDIKPEDKSWLPPDLPVGAQMAVLACDIWNGETWALLVLYVHFLENSSFHVNGRMCQAYRRIKCDTWKEAPLGLLKGRTGPSYATELLVLEDEHHFLVNRANLEHLVRAHAKTRNQLQLQ